MSQGGGMEILIAVLLGSLPSFIFLFGDGPIKMTQLQEKKEVKTT
jgi:hypothetical protein